MDEEKRRQSLDRAIRSGARISKSRLGKEKPKRNAFEVVTGVYTGRNGGKGDAKWKGREGGEEQQDGHSQTLMPWRIVILVK